TEAAVGLALSQEPLGIGLMPCRVCSLEERPFVPADAEPVQPIQNDFGVLLRASLTVGVLDPKHVSAAGMPGVQPVEERGARSTDVQVAGGRWGETDAWLFHSVNGKQLTVNGGGMHPFTVCCFRFALFGERRSGRDSNPR